MDLHQSYLAARQRELDDEHNKSLEREKMRAKTKLCVIHYNRAEEKCGCPDLTLRDIAPDGIRLYDKTPHELAAGYETGV